MTRTLNQNEMSKGTHQEVPPRDGYSRAAHLHRTVSDAAREQKSQIDTIRSKIRYKTLYSLTLLRRDFAEVTTLAETRPAWSQQFRRGRYRANPPIEHRYSQTSFATQYAETIFKREASLYVLARGPFAQRKTIRYTRTAKSARTIHDNHDNLRYMRVHDKDVTIRRTTVGL